MSKEFAIKRERNLLLRSTAFFAAIINTISNRSLAGRAGRASHAGRASREGIEIFYS